MPKTIADLPKDSMGNVMTHPVTGWLSGPVQDTAIILAFDYRTAPNAPEQVMTFVLHPTQAVALANDLQRYAAHIAAQKTPPRSAQS